MQRLSGTDAFFLYSETPSVHMHTLKLGIVEMAPERAADTFEDHKRGVAEHLHLLPMLRKRVVEVPWGFHHPVWIEDPDFDLNRHVFHRTVQAPGSQTEFNAVISDILSHPLDHSRPLWELWILDGLPDRQVGFLVKIHHSMADGVAAARMLQNVTSTPTLTTAPASMSPWQPEPIPSAKQLLRDAFVDHLRQLIHLPVLMLQTFAGMRALFRYTRGREISVRFRLRAPRTPFNATLTPRRAFASVGIALSDVKRVRQNFGCTINDVVLALVTGSLRRLLLGRGVLPAQPLLAAVPVATDRESDPHRMGGNRVSNLYPSLPVHIADPVERLHFVMDATREAKQTHDLLGPDLHFEWSQYTPPRPFRFFARLYTRLHVAERFRPTVNVVVSNVPGPTEPLFINGSRMVSIHSVGPLPEDIGINVTVWSYAGQMYFSVLTCPDLIADPREIIHGLEEELERLLADRGLEAGS